jgi:hypothetical protein
MQIERYLGEHRALRHLLETVQPRLAAELGEHALICHRVDRALRGDDLGALRLAREALERQPETIRRRLREQRRRVRPAPAPVCAPARYPHSARA